MEIEVKFGSPFSADVDFGGGGGSAADIEIIKKKLADDEKKIAQNASDIEELKKRKDASWGNISGSISEQTDLSEALAGKVNGTNGTGENAVAFGLGTTAAGDYSLVSGRYNEEDADGKFAEIVGNGTFGAKSNARELSWDGEEHLSGDVTCGGSFENPERRLSEAVQSDSVVRIAVVTELPTTQQDGVLYVITA